MLTNITYTPDTPEVVEIVSLLQAKQQLRIEPEFANEDDLIESYIDTAIIAAENYCNLHLYPKVMTLTYSSLDSVITLDAYPVSAVTSIKYYKKDEDTLTTLESTAYSVQNQNLKVIKIKIKDLPADIDTERDDAVEVILNVGFAQNKVPKPIQQAILLMVTDLYERREDRPEINTTVANGLMRPYRKYT